MGQQSGFEGADAAAGAASAGMDASRFWDVLHETLGVELPKPADKGQKGADAMSESSDSEGFYAGDASGSDSDDDADMQPGSRAAASGAAEVLDPAVRRAHEAWDAATATDSDDDDGASDVDDDDFLAEYDRAMSEQLRGTRMAETFDKLGGDITQHNAGKERQGAEEHMRTVDVDLNLVSSLLESVASQQGMPGPATNLAAMLGLKMPGADRAS